MKNILIIEDDPIVANTLEAYFEDLYFNVLDVAKSIDEALYSIANNGKHIDIITLDYNIKDGNGIELMHAINYMSNQAEVYLITALDKHDICIDMNKFHLTKYISKPFDINTLNKHFNIKNSKELSRG